MCSSRSSSGCISTCAKTCSRWWVTFAERNWVSSAKRRRTPARSGTRLPVGSSTSASRAFASRSQSPIACPWKPFARWSKLGRMCKKQGNSSARAGREKSRADRLPETGASRRPRSRAGRGSRLGLDGVPRAVPAAGSGRRRGARGVDVRPREVTQVTSFSESRVRLGTAAESGKAPRLNEKPPERCRSARRDALPRVDATFDDGGSARSSALGGVAQRGVTRATRHGRGSVPR